MTLQQLSKALTSVYNTLGNEWITEKLDSQPFDFRVRVRKGGDDDLSNYVVEVYTDRPIPYTITYKNQEDLRIAHGIHYSVLIHKLKDLADYVDTFGGFGKTLGVNLVNLEREY